MRSYIAFTILFLLASFSFGAESDSANTNATFKMNGDVSLLSHYVEYGLSQSDRSPALQGNFWFNFGPQFRLGVFGSNTNYPNDNDHFNLRLNAEVKIGFTQNTSMTIAYAKSQFYKGGDHNADLLGLHFEFWDYRITYDSTSNWEATNDRAGRYAFGKATKLWTSWTWDNEIGYTSPSASSYNTYFDIRTGLGDQLGPVFVEGALTGTTTPSQFNGSGDIFFILSAKTGF
jgi:hypothetical protein